VHQHLRGYQHDTFAIQDFELLEGTQYGGGVAAVEVAEVRQG
jgi:hypothetical protein